MQDLLLTLFTSEDLMAVLATVTTYKQAFIGRETANSFFFFFCSNSCAFEACGYFY